MKKFKEFLEKLYKEKNLPLEALLKKQMRILTTKVNFTQKLHDQSIDIIS